MKFLDQAKIFVKSGDGGAGCVSFRREKYIEFGGEAVIPGNIIIRQRGTVYHPGNNVAMGKDHTIFAVAEGKVEFSKKAGDKTVVSVVTE